MKPCFMLTGTVVHAAVLLLASSASGQSKIVGANFFNYLEIDATNGAGTPVGTWGFNSLRGFAFDPNTNTLYGVDDQTVELTTIEPMTGVVTAVGELGFGGVRDLAFDPNTNTLSHRVLWEDSGRSVRPRPPVRPCLKQVF